ncbi:MAG TPA: PleD family two-component system response regulator [Alphaproteobacteria bacterium]|jgi:two-component system, cell cycle response regulator|nr:PleD family two-component system response regulator [Micavibrio sp.]MBK9561853.1 PleD family two-component system response regulator [Micavibrio sp.]HQX27409.1 PleD family two-component system response regulator [Alphaproteobacteria bacterium]
MSARVLVVDDILPNVKLLEAKLTSEYYDVLTATNGKEALEKVAAESPDLVLLDVMMPGMDGFEVCTRIKQNPALAHIPVVMVTALTDAEDKVRGLESGADDFLSKPINDIALMARVRSLVRLKMALDEWRVRENTANQLGVVEKQSNVMMESADKARVLVVEDKNFEQRKIQETLQRDQDDVTVTENGAKTMELVATQEFDVLIVSLNLAGEDGLRLCSHLKSNERTRSIPIVMIGGEEDMPRIAHGLEIGAHDYILRPVDRNELLARVRTQVRRKRFQERLRSTYEISLSMALTDSLTGLYNRRYLEVHLEKLLLKNQESKKSLAVLLVDIDHFKQVNDKYGHTAGDEVLQIFSQRLLGNLRSFDLVARLGGEEFAVILPDVSEQRAWMVGERLRASISDVAFNVTGHEGIAITTSIGAALIDHNQHTKHEVLERADKCLYEAKKGGRNAVVFEGKGKLNPDEFKEAQRQFIS